jgi:Tol biopolymer transport system component
VFTARSETTHIHRAGLDPVSGRLTTQAMPILTGSMLIMNLAVSPGGDLLALQLRQRGDELLLMRTDGTGLRQLLSDGARNRAPSWQPDGRRLLFYSDRGGHYEVWSIRPDGGDARQISDLGARPWYPQMSPRQDLVATYNETGTSIATYDAHTGRLGEPQPVSPVRQTGHPFFGSTWSPDSRRIAGWTASDINDPDGRIAVHDLETGESFALDAHDDVFWPFTSWLPDGRRFLFNARGRILLASLDGGEPVAILDDPRIESIANVCVAPDGTALYATVRQVEADLWLADLGVEGTD